MRHSDVLDIATMADFLGNVWQCNAIILPAPMYSFSKCYLQPVGEVMRLFGTHQGKNAIDISYNGSIDAVASVTDNKIYIHAVNTSMNNDETVTFDLGGREIAEGRMFCIASEPDTEITYLNIGCFDDTESAFKGNTVTLPKAAVAAIEITLK
jgi:hypothetical protein